MIRGYPQFLDTIAAWEYERRVPNKNELCPPILRCQMDIDAEKLERTVLALPWSAMDQLHEKGSISDPATQNKSVWLFKEGASLSEEFCEKVFAAK